MSAGYPLVNIYWVHFPPQHANLKDNFSHGENSSVPFQKAKTFEFHWDSHDERHRSERIAEHKRKLSPI